MASYSPDEGRQLISFYLQYRLAKQSYRWESGRQDGLELTPYEEAMKKLGDEFEERFTQRFDTMIHRLPFTPFDAQEHFNMVLEDLTEDGLNWGRLVAIYAFASRFAVECYERNIPALVDHIVDWVDDFVRIKFKPFLDANNGWDGFVEFAGKKLEERENTWSTFVKVAATGLGILTLAAAFSRRL